MRLIGASSQLARGADERLVSRRSLAVRPVQRVLEADAGVQAPADRVLEERPRDLPVAVLQPRGREAEPVQRLVDVLDQPDGVGGFVLAVPELELTGLDQDPGDSPARPGRCKPLGVLDGPDTRSIPIPAPIRASMTSVAPGSYRLTEV